MKYLLPLFFLFLLLSPILVQATHGPLHLNLDYPEFGGFDLNLEENQTLQGFIGWLYYFIVGISGIAAFIMLVWGGVQWMSSAGDPTRIGDAKDRIQKALLGLLLVLSSFIIIQIINPELTILKSPFSTDQNTSSSPPPTQPPSLGPDFLPLHVNLTLIVDGKVCETSPGNDACTMSFSNWTERIFTWESQPQMTCRGLPPLDEYISRNSDYRGTAPPDVEFGEYVTNRNYIYTLECETPDGRKGTDTVTLTVTG